MEEEWDIVGLQAALAGEFRVHADVQGWLKADNTLENQDVTERLQQLVETEYAAKVEQVGEQVMQGFERSVMLQVIDNQWREHLAAMDYLRQGIHLRGYAQKNPKQEYKREAFNMFQNLWGNIKQNVASLLIAVQVEQPQDVAAPVFDELDAHAFHSEAPDMEHLLSGSQSDLVADAFNPNDDDETDYSPEALAKRGVVVHRNEPCPCGSGLKYKHCHGKLS